MYSVKCFKCTALTSKVVVQCVYCEKESIATDKYFGRYAECPHCEKNNAIFPEVGVYWGNLCPFCFKSKEKLCFLFEGGERNCYTYISNSMFICLHCCGISDHYKMRSFQDDDSSISPIYSPLEVKNMILSKKDFPEAQNLEKVLKETNKYEGFITQLEEYQKEENGLGEEIDNGKEYKNYKEPFKIHNPPRLRKCETCDILIFSQKCYSCGDWLKQSLLSCCHCKKQAIIPREIFDKHIACPNCKKSFELVSQRDDYQCIYCQRQVTFAIFSNNICSHPDISTYLCFNCCGITGYTNNDYNLRVEICSPFDTKDIMLSENDSPQKQYLKEILRENLKRITTTLKRYDDVDWQYQDEIDPKKKYKTYTEFIPLQFPPLMRCNRCGILTYSLHCHHCKNLMDSFNAKCGHCKERGIATKESSGYAINCSKCGKRSTIKSKKFSSQSCPYCLEEKLKTIDSQNKNVDKIKKVCLHCCGISIYDSNSASPICSPIQVKNMFLTEILSEEKRDLKYTLSNCKEYEHFMVRLKRYINKQEHIPSQHLEAKHQAQTKKQTQIRKQVWTLAQHLIREKINVAAIIFAVILFCIMFSLALYFGN